MCTLTLITHTMSGTLMVSNLVHGCVRWISLKGDLEKEAESQKAEHLSPFSAGFFLVTVNLDLSEWSAIS